MGCIYIATCTVNNKSYIGQSCHSMLRRKAGHEKAAVAGSQFVFHRAIRKYGPSSFEWRVLTLCENQDLQHEEKQHIKTLKTKKPYGYNMTDGGDGVVGLLFSKQHRARISNAAKGRTYSEETKALWSKQRRGKSRKPFNEQWRKNLSIASTGRKASLETRLKLSIAGKGRKHSEETRKKISEGIKSVAHVFGPKISELKKDIPRTEHTKQLLRLANLGKKHSEETKKKMSESRLGTKRSEETKRKMREAWIRRKASTSNCWKG